MILRMGICIPVFDNPLTIEATIKGCLELTEFPVAVIDDGSARPVSDLLSHPQVLENLKRGRLKIFRHEKNLGKGKAIQTGFTEMVRMGLTHMITIDGDGQHFPNQIGALVKISLEHPWDLIIGNRKLESQTVPKISKFGRKFSNFWVNFQTNMAVADSQSGFRIYPLFLVQNLRFWTKKFDFEIEVLIRLLWTGVNIREAQIEVYYPPAGERVSHFNKFWDNAKISFLNAILVVISLLKSHRSPGKSAVAVGLGVAVGCSPFYGFHTLIVAALSFFFRLNGVFLFLGSQISIPPLAPFLVLASVEIGKFLKISNANAAIGFSIQWLVGSMLLGLGLGLLTGTLTFILMTLSDRKTLNDNVTKPRAWNGKTRGGKFGNWFLKTMIKYFGLKPAYFCLYFIVPYFYLFAPKARRSANEYWRILNPEKRFFIRQFYVLGQLHIFAQILLDRVYQSFSKTPRFQINSQGVENIIKSTQSPHGLVMMTAHAGGWDLASALIKDEGFAGYLQMVQYEGEGLTFNKIKDKSDSNHVRALVSNQETQPILKIRQWLGEGKPVGLMGDRPLGNQFELIPFFGKLAPLDCTAFRIAAACKSPLLFTFGFKGKGKVYDFFATVPKIYSYGSQGSKAYQCYLWINDYAQALESFLRRYPNQWSNYYPFWSTIPNALENEQKLKQLNSLIEKARRPAMAGLELESDPKSAGEKLSL